MRKKKLPPLLSKWRTYMNFDFFFFFGGLCLFGLKEMEKGGDGKKIGIEMVKGLN